MKPECILVAENCDQFREIQRFANYSDGYITARIMTWDNPPAWRISIWKHIGKTCNAKSLLELGLGYLPPTILRLDEV